MKSCAIFPYLCICTASSMGKKACKKIERRAAVATVKQTPIVSKRVLWLSLGSLWLAVLALYYPIRQYEFVYWDDDKNIFENEAVMAPLSAHTTRTIFTTPVIGNYNPLSNWSFALEREVFVPRRPGETEDQYLRRFSAVVHTTNLILHLINTTLVFFVFLYLSSSWQSAWLTALLFGIHPLHVESVAWATERKDVLFGLFFLLSALAYLYYRNVRRRAKLYYWASLWSFVLGLFAKIQTVTLPLTLVLIDYFKGYKNVLRSVIEKWPYFLLSLSFGLLGIYFLAQQGSLDTNERFGLIERFFFANYSLATYLYKFFLPYPLSPLYPYPASLNWMHYLSPIVTVGFFYGLYRAHRLGLRWVVFGGLWFFVNIMFLLQLLGAGQGYLADRFSYIPYIGLGFVLAEGIFRLSKGTRFRPFLIGATALWVVALWVTAYRYLPVWSNTVALFTHVLDRYPNTMTPHRNLGNYYRDRGMHDKALEIYSRGLRLKDDAEMYNSRAKLYFIKGDVEKAIRDYEKAIQLMPDRADFYVNLGASYAKAGRYDKGLEAIEKGLSIDPDNYNARFNRSIIYLYQERYHDQIRDLEWLLQRKPNQPDLWYEMANSYLRLNNPRKALESLRRGLQHNPRADNLRKFQQQIQQWLQKSRAQNPDR